MYQHKLLHPNISSDLGGVSDSHDFQNVSVLLIGLYIMNIFDLV